MTTENSQNRQKHALVLAQIRADRRDGLINCQQNEDLLVGQFGDERHDFSFRALAADGLGDLRQPGDEQRSLAVRLDVERIHFGVHIRARVGLGFHCFGRYGGSVNSV